MHQAPPQTEALGFSATVLLSRKAATGIEVPDTEPRARGVPPESARGLANDPAAHDVRNRLPHSNKERFVLSIESDDARQRRIATTAAQLSEGRR